MAFRAGRSQTRPPMHAPSTMCSPASAAARSSDRPPPSTATRSTRRFPAPDGLMLRLLSLALFFGIWSIGSGLAGAHMLPSPEAGLTSIFAAARFRTLCGALGATLVRVVLSFSLATVAGTAIGLLMGRAKWADAVGDPWLVVV